MQLEIRNDRVVVDGYVNAVERYSKVLRDKDGAFIEKIKAGTFQRALDRAKAAGRDVKVLLNHDYKKELTSTRDASTILKEDSIGLRCRCEIKDRETIEKAKKGKLKGWSFGFICIRENENAGEDGEVKHRDVTELDLREVSILDDTKVPAYDGTSIETRDSIIELRAVDDAIEIVDHTGKEKMPDLYEYKNRYLLTKATV